MTMIQGEERMKATIVDVAKESGVSVATVSRVVNGNYPVREKTRLKVENAIKKLEYVPNLQARELNTQRSSSIGVVVPSFDNMFFAQVLDGIEERLRRSSYSLLLACAQNDAAREEECVRDFITRNVSGVIVVSPNTETAVSEFYENTAARLPLVFVNSARELAGISYVTSDQRGGARAALEHLFHYGHERILFVQGENSDSYRIKEKAYREIMRERGAFHPEDIVNVGEGNRIETVENTMFILMDMMFDLEPTAIFCCNDLMAMGAVNACQRMGRRVPQDISVIGYDNTALSQYTAPQLTTIDQHMGDLGREAARLMLKQIEENVTENVVLANTVVERETTGFRVE